MTKHLPPGISVVVPVFNAEKTINRCLEALVNQSVPEDTYEIIVVNDGSNDRTEYEAGKFPVRYFRQHNQGPAAARNYGVREAGGNIILFTDADCIASQNWIEEMIKPFDDQEVSAVKGAYRTGQGSVVARFAQIEFEERYNLLKKRRCIDMVDTYSAGYRKNIFQALGGFDPSFPVANNEDTEFSYRMSKAGYKMVFNPEAIVCHLNHPDTLRKYVKIKFWRGYWRMVVYMKYPAKMFVDTYTPKVLKVQVLLASMLLATIFPGFFIHTFYRISLGLLIMHLLISIPFLFFSLGYDKRVAFFSPFLLLARSLAIGAGVATAFASSGFSRHSSLNAD